MVLLLILGYLLGVFLYLGLLLIYEYCCKSFPLKCTRIVPSHNIFDRSISSILSQNPKNTPSRPPPQIPLQNTLFLLQIPISIPHRPILLQINIILLISISISISIYLCVCVCVCVCFGICIRICILVGNILISIIIFFFDFANNLI